MPGVEAPKSVVLFLCTKPRARVSSCLYTERTLPGSAWSTEMRKQYSLILAVRLCPARGALRCLDLFQHCRFSRSPALLFSRHGSRAAFQKGLVQSPSLELCPTSPCCPCSLSWSVRSSAGAVQVSSLSAVARLPGSSFRAMASTAC